MADEIILVIGTQANSNSMPNLAPGMISGVGGPGTAGSPRERRNFDRKIRGVGAPRWQERRPTVTSCIGCNCKRSTRPDWLILRCTTTCCHKYQRPGLRSFHIRNYLLRTYRWNGRHGSNNIKSHCYWSSGWRDKSTRPSNCYWIQGWSDKSGG